MNKCSVKYCRNKVKGKGKCNSCASRQKRARHPLRYAYDVLKMNAKRREKPFTITFDYFKKFAIETDYVAGKGRTKKSYSVDRIKNEIGYVPGNLRVLTVSDNSRKLDELIKLFIRRGVNPESAKEKVIQKKLY